MVTAENIANATKRVEIHKTSLVRKIFRTFWAILRKKGEYSQTRL
jgi:hypothetical protein